MQAVTEGSGACQLLWDPRTGLPASCTAPGSRGVGYRDLEVFPPCREVGKWSEMSNSPKQPWQPRILGEMSDSDINPPKLLLKPGELQLQIS